ncbi:putative Solute carrier family 41 member 2 [Hypsibius exemplaris]|uniref:Solute carrier family 41 member 2 n=1 Tax=Hypsibius exemplaris TaxID=2072580 RepID=A0A1W0WK65_HYPEX|nr:putative Solute carrier family 41 member 2 [Hypsibius exemplaris]
MLTRAKDLGSFDTSMHLHHHHHHHLHHHHHHQPYLSPLVVRHNENLQDHWSFGSPLGTADSSTVMLEQPEEGGGGYFNSSFSNLSDHVTEAGLPAVIVIDGGEDGHDGDSPGVEIILAPSGHHLLFSEKEGLQTLVLQIFIPFLLAGCGMVGAGILLDEAQVPPGYTVCRSPCETFCSRATVNARTAGLLMLMIVPGHLVFLFLITLVHVGSTSITLRFTVIFLVMAIVQVALLLYTADILTHFVWKRGLDPDSTAIPYLTALGEILGTGLLALGFYLLWVSGNSNDDVGD